MDRILHPNQRSDGSISHAEGQSRPTVKPCWRSCPQPGVETTDATTVRIHHSQGTLARGPHRSADQRSPSRPTRLIATAPQVEVLRQPGTSIPRGNPQIQTAMEQLQPPHQECGDQPGRSIWQPSMTRSPPTLIVAQPASVLAARDVDAQPATPRCARSPAPADAYARQRDAWTTACARPSSSIQVMLDSVMVAAKKGLVPLPVSYLGSRVRMLCQLLLHRPRPLRRVAGHSKTPRTNALIEFSAPTGADLGDAFCVASRWVF